MEESASDPQPAGSIAPTRLTAAATDVDITPPVGIYLHNWAMSPHATATGIHRPLAASLLLLAVEGERFLFVTLDFGWWMDAGDERLLRDTIISAAGLPEERVLMTVSHTHSGPSITRDDSDREGGQFIGPYLDETARRIAEEVSALSRKLVPATLDWAAGKCTLATNRDLYRESEQRFVVGLDPNGAADDTLMVGRVATIDGECIAVVTNYAIHLTSLGGDNSLISPDLLGAARDMVREELGSPLIFLPGAAGDLAPARQYSGDTEMADANGRVFGHAVLAALNQMPPPGTALRYSRTVESGAPLGYYEAVPSDPDQTQSAKQRVLRFPTKDNMPGLAGESDVDADRQVRAARIRANVTEGNTLFPLTVWQVGAMTIFAYPGEAYSQLQTTLRAEFPHRAMLFVNLANGPHCGYIAPEEAHRDGRYPAWQTPLTAECFDLLEAACRTELKALSDD